MINKIEIIKFIENPNSEYLEFVTIYDGHDSLDWCLKGYKYHLQFLWANSGLVDGNGAPLVNLTHVSTDEVYDKLHNFLCTFDDWDTKYHGIENWGINKGINWHKSLQNPKI
jgi:hypothetical protein